MPMPPPLPRTLFTELGKLVVVWANIEQDLILQASAMAAEETDGIPLEYLRMDFKRLREKWFGLCRDRFHADIFNKVVQPINMKLCDLAPLRGNAVHGLWSVKGRGKYDLSFFEQKKTLVSFHADYTLLQLRTLVSMSYDLAKEIHRFRTGAHPCFKNKKRTIAKIVGALIPLDKRQPRRLDHLARNLNSIRLITMAVQPNRSC